MSNVGGQTVDNFILVHDRHDCNNGFEFRKRTEHGTTESNMTSISNSTLGERYDWKHDKFIKSDDD